MASRFPSICRSVHRHRCSTGNDSALAREEFHQDKCVHCPDAIKLAQGHFLQLPSIWGSRPVARVKVCAYETRSCSICLPVLRRELGMAHGWQLRESKQTQRDFTETQAANERGRIKAQVALRPRGGPRGGYGDLRRVEEVTNKRHRISRAFFHQPMPRARDNSLLNIGCHVAHDFRLQRTK